MELQVFINDQYQNSKPRQLKLVKDYGPVFYQTGPDEFEKGKLHHIKGREKHFIKWCEQNDFLLVRDADSEGNMVQGAIAFRKLRLKK